MNAPLMFAFCFMFLATILLLAVIHGRIYWGIKAMLIVISLVFCGWFYIALVGSLGYPTPEQPVGVFQFLGAYIREPYPAKNDPGAIYIWMLTEKMDRPRAITLPFSMENRRTVSRAKQKLKDGAMVYMGINRQPSGNNDNTGGGSGSQRGVGIGANNVPYSVHGTATLELATPIDTVPKKESEQ